MIIILKTTYFHSNMRDQNHDRSYKLQIKTRKRFSEKPIVAFSNSTVIILDFYIKFSMYPVNLIIFRGDFEYACLV